MTTREDETAEERAAFGGSVVAVTLGVAVAYLAGAWLGWRLTWSNGDVSLLWPAAGVSAGAVFVLGTRAAAGVAAGAFVAALIAHGAASPETGGLRVVAAAAVSTLGALSLALAAKALIARAGLSQNPFADVRSMGRLLLCLAGASVAGATVELLALSLRGGLEASAAVVGLALWFGNVMGLLIVGPIVVALAARAMRRAAVVAFVAAVGLGATWAARYQLSLASADAPEALADSLATISDEILILGGGATAVLAFFAAYVLRRSEDIRALVARRTAELAESERDLRTALDSLPGAMVLTGPDTSIRLVSAEADRLVGFPEGTIGAMKTQSDIIRRLASRGDYGKGEDPDQVVARRQGRSQDAPTVIRVPDGRYVEIRRRPTPHGGLAMTGMDVTEREMAFDELSAAAGRVRDILEQSPVGVLISVDDESEDDGLIVFANGRFLDMIGIDRDAVGVARTSQFMPKGPEREQHERALERGETLRDMEVAINRTDGGALWALLSIMPMDYDGRRCALVWIYDITERKAAERAIAEAKGAAEAALDDLRRTQERLVTAEKMASLGQLTAGVAHEIKNPLNFINNFAETSVELVEELEEALAPARDRLDEDLRDEVDDLTVTLKGDLQKIAGHGKRADGIIRSMLMHARGGSGERREADVNALVEEAMTLAYHGERARDGMFKADCETKSDPAAGTAEVEVEELTRVLVNVATNALQAVKARAGDGADGYAPRVVATTRDLGEEVSITVRDNGTGMPEEVRQKIFEPFFTTKPTGEGTGLGLSMSYDIVVHQHGGRLEVDSAPDEFTEFRITLPRRAPAPPEQGRADG